MLRRLHATAPAEARVCERYLLSESLHHPFKRLIERQLCPWWDTTSRRSRRKSRIKRARPGASEPGESGLAAVNLAKTPRCISGLKFTVSGDGSRKRSAVLMFRLIRAKELQLRAKQTVLVQLNDVVSKLGHLICTLDLSDGSQAYLFRGPDQA